MLNENNQNTNKASRSIHGVGLFTEADGGLVMFAPGRARPMTTNTVENITGMDATVLVVAWCHTD